jgi:hypothetical protein
MKAGLLSKITNLLTESKLVHNLARKKFIALFVVALAKSRNVQFHAIAKHFNDNADPASSEVRIQDFLREVDIDYTLLTVFLLGFLSGNRKLRLCIDRTEWDFGSHQSNILMVVAGYGDFMLPIYWAMLDNSSGNSSAQDRIDAVSHCIRLIGKQRLGLVVADREFVGNKWLKWLKDNNINFVMRLPKGHYIYRADCSVQSVEGLGLSTEVPLVIQSVMVDGVWANVWVMKLKDGDFLFLFGTVTAKFMGQLYRKRWGIEACFQNLKQRGFDLEKSHLKNDGKLRKLIALVSITYAVCTSLGIYQHKKVKPIRTKKHGYKENSFARVGIDLIQKWFRPQNNIPEKTMKRILAFFRLLAKRLRIYHEQKKDG